MCVFFTERTDKIPMNSIKTVVSEPIDDHEEYHIMVGVCEYSALGSALPLGPGGGCLGANTPVQTPLRETPSAGRHSLFPRQTSPRHTPPLPRRPLQRAGILLECILV